MTPEPRKNVTVCSESETCNLRSFQLIHGGNGVLLPLRSRRTFGSNEIVTDGAFQLLKLYY